MVAEAVHTQGSSSRSSQDFPAGRARLGFENLEGREVPAFLAPVSYTAGANPAGIAVGDFNGDGRDDMAARELAHAHPGSSRAVNDFGDVGQRSDDGFVTSAAREAACGLHLGAHRPGRRSKPASSSGVTRPSRDCSGVPHPV